MATPSPPSADASKSLRFYKQANFPNLLGYTLLFALLFLALGAMSYHYYYGEFGVYRAQEIQKELDAQLQKNREQRQKNQRLAADVLDLKNGLGAIEEHARLDLGLIKKDEIFVRLAPKVDVVYPSYAVDTEAATEVLDAWVGE